MKKRFSKLLILSMTTALTISMASANAFAEDDASEVSATYACEASIPNASDYGIPWRAKMYTEAMRYLAAR